MEEVLSSLFALIFVLAMVRFATSKRMARKNQKRPSTIASRVEPARNAEYGSADQAAARAAKAAKTGYAASGKRAMTASDAIRDSKDDWLSHQLKEEQRALRDVSAMFQLKVSHEASCDAEELRKISRR
ncbi:MAG: hypothetical protein MJ059_07435 [Lachnospiraceae bacterium]|nr:hypothetical protein [Lachnospiraceae bacterium]